ncbi:hypothetical protein DdX_09999 [Ditylenchus destructor]|uniref:F-box domain-containing protein n=1 Tax=Ditylenchus destructor TaxID=166010 RepID=A0AAD4R5U0_9BILA|nr:hypothetical protein DdX_09999 [Ditylenchus destructor]
MSCSKPVPPFVLDLLYYLNRDQLERFSIVCRPLKNLIAQNFQSKPYRIFDHLLIRGGGSYALIHKDVQWHPNRDDYNVQQFLDGQKCNIGYAFYSFAEMRPYLGPTVRIEWTSIYVDEDFTYNPEHVAEMESISYLWRSGRIRIWEGDKIGAEGFQRILNSPTVLQCQTLSIDFHGNEYFSFKDSKALYSVNKMEIAYYNQNIDPNVWPQFLEQPGVKPVVVLRYLKRESINEILDQLTQAFSSAVSPNTYKIIFEEVDEPLTVFREINYRSREKLELKNDESDYELVRCSLPPIVFDFLHYLNRGQLERFSIVCRPFKNFIERYFSSKPYRVFDQLDVYGGIGSYALVHNGVRWHPDQAAYNAQQFLAGRKCNNNTYYSFAEMRPYLGPTVRIEQTYIYVAGDTTYNPEHISEMESMAYLWRNGDVSICNARNDGSRIVVEDFQPILNSPTILQCRNLFMDIAHFSFKDCKALFSVKKIFINYRDEETDPQYWLQFLDQPGAKPVVVLEGLHRESINKLLDQLTEPFSSAVSPNAFKIVFAKCDEPLIEFREMNSKSREKLQLKKKFSCGKTYALERCSLPPFVLDVLRYLNRHQLERFSIVCCLLKNLIEQYFHTKPYRMFDQLLIYGGMYALEHNYVRWHPNRGDYSVQQFLAGQKCSIDIPWNRLAYYSLAEMRPYLGSTNRIKKTWIYVSGDSTYNPEHIAEMESISYLWRDGEIHILSARKDYNRIVAEHFQPILNSPTILQCQNLFMDNAHFSFKDCKALYSVNKIVAVYNYNEKTDPHYWPEFLEQPGVKPVVFLRGLHRESIDSVLNQFSETFSSAVSPIEFKIVFEQVDEPLTVFREMNYRSCEKLNLKRLLENEYELVRCSLPPIVFDFLHYLDRGQLERFSIVCRLFKNFIDRYLSSKPYRVFDRLEINGGLYALEHNNVYWHPNRDDYSVQQFLASQECSFDNRGYSFVEMRPYLGSTVRIEWIDIFVAGDSPYNPVHITEMESMAYIWRDGKIWIQKPMLDGSRIGAEDLQLILNSPTILQCRTLSMENAHFSFKDYKVLYSVKVIEIDYENDETDPNYWSQFFEQQGVKPAVVLRQLHPESVVGMLERLYKDFSSAISPNAYKIIFAQNGRLMIKSIVQSFKVVYTYSQPTVPQNDEELIEFQDKNKTSGEKWEFKKPAEFSDEYPEFELSENNKYVLERSRI